ncbi:hypothetical protein C8R46DRAFT_1284700 [Mycena filopes]|nr:hypothetical protein C8R46DRAFT_1284700 [Mycena filopes]
MLITPPGTDSADRARIDKVVVVPQSPILDSLPPELLSEIFTECLPTYSAVPAASRAPLLLAGVCREWRAIALSTPSIWSTFILPVNMGTMTDNSPILRLFDAWIARGGNYPLTMVISCSASPRATPPPYALPESFISALGHSSSRWHDVHLVLPRADFWRLQPNEGFPFLRRLAVKAAYYPAQVGSATPPPLAPLDLFRDAPALDDVSLEEGFSLSNISLPLDQLSYFDLQAATTDAHFPAFLQAPNLVEIRLNLHYLDARFVPSQELVHSKVKTLNIQFPQGVHGGGETLAILRYMTCSALERIAVRGMAPLLAPNLLRFLSRSSPPLREFVLDLASHLSDALPDTIPVLMAMPTLELLELRPLAAETANALFAQMHDSDNAASVFLPRLRTLRVEVTFGYDDGSAWTYTPLVDMLVARWNFDVAAGGNVDVAQLRLFKFGFSNPHTFSSAWGNPCPELDPQSHSRLARLGEEGMDIELVLGDVPR